MNIAILGGSFDPPHNGHLAIANRLLKLKYFDQVWLMPCYQHPFAKNLSSPEKRLGMTKFLETEKTRLPSPEGEANGGQVKVSDHEIRNKTTSFTIDTLKYFANKNPQNEYSWIIGTDQVGTFTKWREWQEIINNFKLIVVPRTDYAKAPARNALAQNASQSDASGSQREAGGEKELKNIAKQVTHPENIILIDRQTFPPVYISSRLIRRKIKEKKSITSLVPKRVKKYIIQNKLYR